MNKFGLLILIAIIILSFSQISMADGINLEVGEDGLIQGSVTEEERIEAWNTMLSSYRVFVMGFLGIASISMLGLFIYNFINLGASGSNPGSRSKAVGAVLWTGIATAFLGATFFFFSMFYGLFK